MDAIWGSFLDFLPGNWDAFKLWFIWRFLLQGLWVSVQIAIVAIILSLTVGITMSVGRLSPVPIVKFLATTYIEHSGPPASVAHVLRIFGAAVQTEWARHPACQLVRRRPLRRLRRKPRRPWRSRSTTARLSLKYACGYPLVSKGIIERAAPRPELYAVDAPCGSAMQSADGAGAVSQIIPSTRTPRWRP